MIKASILLLTFAVVAFSAPQVDAQGINQFVTGFLDSTPFKVNEDFVEECINGFVHLGEHDFLQGQQVSEIEQAELVIEALSVLDSCKSAFGKAYNMIVVELQSMLANKDLYIENIFERRTDIMEAAAGFVHAVTDRDMYKAGRKFGRLSMLVFGRGNEQIKAIRQENHRRFRLGATENDTGLPVALDNVTNFVEGFGNGFGIPTTTNGLYEAIEGIVQAVNSTAKFAHDAEHDPSISVLASDLNNAWNGFSAFTILGTQSADQIYTDFQPVIQLAEKNATEVQVQFEQNLKAAPLRAGFDMLALKTDWSAGNYFGAGNAAGELSTIGLKGMDNVTTTN